MTQFFSYIAQLSKGILGRLTRVFRRSIYPGGGVVVVSVFVVGILHRVPGSCWQGEGGEERHHLLGLV